MASKTDEIRQYIFNILQKAKSEGFTTKDIRAGEIQKEMNLGNVPVIVCNAMRSIPCFATYDILSSPPSGNSTTLLHRYYLEEVSPATDTLKSMNITQLIPKSSMNHRRPFPIGSYNIDDLLNNVLSFYNKLSIIDNHRYRSWEHCYSYFAKHQNTVNEEIIDLMCLHLSNYLASWGMFRGAAFLLQKDYRIHLEVVRLILNDQYRILRTNDIRNIDYDEYIKRIFELSENITEIYRNKTTDFENENGRNASDTLITKILLGVFGCVPAYDRYLKEGLKFTKIASGQFSPNSISQLLNFYDRHYDALETVRSKISENGVEYTPMKIIDMCFWQLGYEQDKQKLAFKASKRGR
ncbi:MAG: hypothetical protein ACYDEX_05775 [Mobilitalea sp.]